LTVIVGFNFNIPLDTFVGHFGDDLSTNHLTGTSITNITATKVQCINLNNSYE